MPIEMVEKQNSPRGTDEGNEARVDREYFVFGSDVYGDIVDHVKANMPASYRGLYPMKPDVQPEKRDDWWTATIAYAPKSVANANQGGGSGGAARGFSFDTTGSTATAMMSNGTVAAYGTGAATGDFSGLVNVTDDGVEGVEYEVQGFAFSLQQDYDLADIDSDFLAAVYGLSKRVNNDSYTVTINDVMVTFQAGELFFRGATGNGGSIDFHFIGAPNRTGLAVGSITGIAKGGHQYMWARYRKKEISGIKDIGQEPVGVYIEEIYLPDDFTDLPL